NLPTDALVDTFHFLSRSQLEDLLLSSRRFCHVIMSKMATFCLRPVENFHLTYDHEERCYKLKALPVDGKPFYYRARVDEAFSIVPKLLCSTFVQELVFVDVVLSDGLCKSIRDIGHTTRIGKLQ
ncbi:hypothetical protein AAVH_28863, partial [Aphelenchoides avenae]